MTTAEPLVYYPQYCFHLSPTINTWCPLRATDIANLRCQPGFQDIDVFFYLNYPIRWVRIVGVVVAIDDYYGRRVYTLDDGTGQCIECTISIPRDTKGNINHRDNGESKTAEPQAASTRNTTIAHGAETHTSTGGTAPTPGTPDNIEVGTVLDVKGSVDIFRGEKQIKIQKATPIRSTNEEALFWDKIRDFRRDVLYKPWTLKDREVRKCRRLQHVEGAGSEEKQRKRKARMQAESSGSNQKSNSERLKRSAGPTRSTDDAVRSAKATGTYRDAKTESRVPKAGNGGKYSALGL